MECRVTVNLHDEHADANMRGEDVERIEEAKESERGTNYGGLQAQADYNYKKNISWLVVDATGRIQFFCG